MPTFEEAERLAQFRNRLVTYANEVVQGNADPPIAPDRAARLGGEAATLSQEYGSLAPLITRYGGQAGMHQFGMMVSQDVVRDTIQRPDHPSYSDVARLAIGHVDMVLGAVRRDARPPGISASDLYRWTSPVYWIGRLVALVVWLFTAKVGRVAAAVFAAVALAIISGVAGAVVDSVLGR